MVGPPRPKPHVTMLERASTSSMCRQYQQGVEEAIVG
jgi:hypothetical protein